MDPIITILQLGPHARPVGSYGLLLAIAALVGGGLVLRAAARARLDVGAVLAALAVAVGSAFAGAWLLFVVVAWARTGSPWHGVEQPGLVFFGGATGGLAGLAVACRAFGVPAGRLVDAAVPAWALAHALGRLGCFLGGCCFGRPWDGPWSVVYRHPWAPAAYPSVPRHPVPLYEAAGLLLLAAVFALWRPRRIGTGSRLVLYLAAYALLRAVLEGFRGDVVRGLWLDGRVSTSQAFAFVLLASAVMAWTLRSRPRMRVTAFALSLGVLAAGWPFLARGDVRRLQPAGSPVVWLPEGSFVRGSDAYGVRRALLLCLPAPDAVFPTGCSEELFDDEQPARRIRVSAFGIDRTEVTRAAWRRCAVAGVCPPSRLGDDDARVSAPDHPVAGVSWHEAQGYCRFVGGRLPTEAEWERAARGGTGWDFPWGQTYNDRLANHGQAGGRPDGVDGHRYAAPVASHPGGASPHGLLDMAGNVWEWTADRYDPDTYRDGPRVDPTGGQAGSERVVRGGSWRSPPHTLRTTHREHRMEAGAWADVGFRCAYDP